MTRQVSPFAALFGSSVSIEGPHGYDNPDQLLWALDPQLYLSNLAVAVSPAEGSAKAAMMAWVLALPEGMDPANAAKRLLDLPLFSGIEPSKGEAGRLIELLRQISHFPREKLGRMQRGRRRQLHA